MMSGPDVPSFESFVSTQLNTLGRASKEARSTVTKNIVHAFDMNMARLQGENIRLSRKVTELNQSLTVTQNQSERKTDRISALLEERDQAAHRSLWMDPLLIVFGGILGAGSAILAFTIWG